MATQEICTYKSVTLQPGEVFTLPPGATLVSATDVNAITSTCAIPTLETLECYCLRVIIQNDTGGATEPFQYNAVKTNGLWVGETFYPWADGDGTIQNFSDIQDHMFEWMAAMPSIGGLFSGFCQTNQSEGSYGDGFTLCFKTIPSIGNNLKLEYQTYDHMQGPSNLVVLIPAEKYADTPGSKCGCV